MALKHHTIILVPHARARLRKWHITNRQLGIFGASFLALTLAACYIAWSYFTTTVDRRQITRLQQENENLREVNDSFKNTVEGLETRLSEYEKRTRDLAILAGLDTTNTGIGGPTGFGLDASALEGDDGPSAGLNIGDGLPGDLDFLHFRTENLDGTLDTVAQSLAERQRWLASMPTIAPVKALMSSRFGMRTDPVHGRRAMHSGIDFAASPGAPVVATADGLVTRARRLSGLGNAVYVSHGFGIVTRYGHMARLAVKEGQQIKRGDVVGYVGNTGRSTGYHLHYEVRVDGKAENPIGYLLDYSRRR